MAHGPRPLGSGGTRLGHFDKATGTTRDRWGNKLAEGNTVASLIVEDRKQG
jgi:hypothetical protein